MNFSSPKQFVMSYMQKPVLYLSLGLAVVVVVLAAFIFIDRSDIKVTVHNLGPDTLENVAIGTDQASYPVGDILPGESAVKGIDVLGDSSLSIRHAGHPEWQTTDSYMTRGYVGEMKLELKGGEVVDFTDDLRIWP